MSIQNFNNLQLNASYELGQSGSTGQFGSRTNSGVDSTGAVQQSGTSLSLGAQGSIQGIDWFSQLNTGASHQITPRDPSGTSQPIDSHVDAILQKLGIQD